VLEFLSFTIIYYYLLLFTIIYYYLLLFTIIYYYYHLLLFIIIYYYHYYLLLFIIYYYFLSFTQKIWRVVVDDGSQQQRPSIRLIIPTRRN